MARVARVVFITLALMGIVPLATLLVNGDVLEHIQLYAEQPSPDMAQPLHGTEQGSQGQSWEATGALLLDALLQWRLWVLPGVLILFSGFLCCVRKTNYLPESRSKFWVCVATLAVFLTLLFRKIAQRTLAAGGSDQQSSSSEEEDEEEDEEEEEDSDLDETRDVDRVWADSTQWPAPHAASKCQLVEELVDDLLRACRGKTCHSFVPRLQPAIGVACVCEGWSAQEDNVIYRLLVPMRAPPGHAFRVELGNPKETPKSKKSCLRVELECMCARERLLGDMLCFLHHTRRELRENQEASLLNTLCRASYLDVQKTTRWFQQRVKAAWKCLPQSRDWGLELVPSDHSCKIKLTPPSKSTFTIEMTLGVQLDESGTFLSFD